MNLHTFGQALLQLFQTNLDPLNNFKSIFSKANNDDARHGFALTVELDYAATNFRSDLNICNLSKHNRRMRITINTNRNHLQVFNRSYITFSPNHKLGLAHLQQASSDIHIRTLNRHVDVLQREPVGPEFFRINFHLILFYISSRTGDLRHPGERHQLITQIPVLN